MAVITRTIVRNVLRTKDENGETLIIPLGRIEPAAEQALKMAYGDNAAIGYMPLTYVMEEENFVRESKLITDVENTPLFSTEKSCPKSAAELKKFMKTSNQ